MTWLIVMLLALLVVATGIIFWLWYLLREEQVANIALQAERCRTYGRGYDDGYRGAVGLSEAACHGIKHTERMLSMLSFGTGYVGCHAWIPVVLAGLAPESTPPLLAVILIFSGLVAVACCAVVAALLKTARRGEVETRRPLTDVDRREGTEFLARRLREVRESLESVKRGGAP